GDLLEGLLRTAGDALDELGGVASEVALDDLEDTARVLERFVPGRRRLEQRLHQRLERRAGRQRWRVLVGGLVLAGLLRGRLPAGAGLPAGSRVLPRLVVVLAEEGVERPLLDLFLELLQPGEHTVEVLGVLVVGRDDG